MLMESCGKTDKSKLVKLMYLETSPLRFPTKIYFWELVGQGRSIGEDANSTKNLWKSPHSVRPLNNE